MTRGGVDSIIIIEARVEIFTRIITIENKMAEIKEMGKFKKISMASSPRKVVKVSQIQTIQIVIIYRI